MALFWGPSSLESLIMLMRCCCCCCSWCFLGAVVAFNNNKCVLENFADCEWVSECVSMECRRVLGGSLLWCLFLRKKEQHHPHIYLSTVVVGSVLWLFALFLLCQYFIHSLVVAFNVCGWMEQKSHLTSRSTPPTLYVVSGLWSSPLISGLTICWVWNKC